MILLSILEKNCGLATAYVYYKFKDKKDNNLAVRFDHEQTNLKSKTKFRFYQNLNIPNVSMLIQMPT